MFRRVDFRNTKFLNLLLLTVFLSQPVSAEVDPDAWIGLWIGEGQIGDFPDFGTFSLGDDYIMISEFDGSSFKVSGQTHFSIKRYGVVAGRGFVSGESMIVEGTHCTVQLGKKQLNTYPTSQDYLLAETDNDCGSMYSKFQGKYHRFKNSERR